MQHSFTNMFQRIYAAAGVLAFVILMPMISLGDDSDPKTKPALKVSESNPGPQATTYEGPGRQPKVGLTDETVLGETWGDHSYVIPFIEVIAFEAMLNLYDRRYIDEEIYGTTYKTFERNFKMAPVIDTDSFEVNQLFHPYQGAMYFDFARSAGLSYWQSLLYSIAGSELWETAGETGPPSFNDQVNSGIGGSFLGEPLFRMANLLLEGGGRNPGNLRELGAALISPPTGVNRLLFGDRFDRVFPSHNPPTFMRLRFGMSTTARVSDNGPLETYDRQQSSVDLLMSYGLPGKRKYTYDRPFDYFELEFAAGSGRDSFANLMTRGLIYGSAYDAGDACRGIWGVYGSYDYISPQIFRVSSTAVSLGTTAQWWLMQGVALQYSALGGVGYAAAGTIREDGDRDYRYGTAPQGLLAFRLIMAERVMMDMNGRVYYITDLHGSSPSGHELIERGNAGLSVRVYGQHAVGIQFTSTSRDGHVVGAADRRQTEEVASVVYTLLGDDNFGSVKW
ncbi:MAG: DUF3943 domain-containing protein [Verrucomicrobia bacterium]|nr:DUF3943 domain-containing protein [Verrucomicrobiota bacterium]